MLVPLSPARRPLRTTPATTLAEIPQTLQPEALETKEELDAFYQESIRELRGIDRIGQLRICLEDAHAQDLPFKAFLLGHPGVGKTTELSRLLIEVQDKFRPLRLSVTSELNPGSLRFYDVLLLILMRLVHEVSQPSVIGFEDTDLQAMVKRVRDHLATKWEKHLRIKSGDFGAGFELPFLKLFGNIKLGASKEQGQEEYQLSLVSELVDLMNGVLGECNRLLEKHQNGRQWIIILEDFEKLGLAPSAVRDLFAGLRPHLQGFSAHLIAVIPVWLPYSAEADVVLPPNIQPFVVRDIPVYQQDHSKNDPAIDVLKEVVAARVNENLFEPAVLERVCIASGGNLRDLFDLIRNAMLSARLRRAATISSDDANAAIASLRNDYKQLLGNPGHESQDVSLDDKLNRLVGIYQREDAKVEVPDRVLYLLLRQRCALQYNGQVWIGVHPVVVDLLMQFGKLPDGSPGGCGS